MTRRLGIVVFAVALLGASPSAAAAAPSPAVPCVVRITAMSFHPRRVVRGGTSTVRVQAWNCTKQTQPAMLTWIGQFVGPSPGLPAGCPVVDPVAQSVDVAPHARFNAGLGFTVFSTCAATSLSETARFTDVTGTVLAERTVSLIVS